MDTVSNNTATGLNTNQVAFAEVERWEELRRIHGQKNLLDAEAVFSFTPGLDELPGWEDGDTLAARTNEARRRRSEVGRGTGYAGELDPWATGDIDMAAEPRRTRTRYRARAQRARGVQRGVRA